MNNAIKVKLLALEDTPSVDSVFRSAFGTELGHPEPENFAPGRSCRSRLVVEPLGGLGAFLKEELVGVAFSTTWGSLGVFGPLAVKSTHWGLGVAQALLPHSIDYFRSQKVTDIGLCTFPASPKHVSLYQKFGFYPRSLIAMMSRLTPSPESAKLAPDLHLFSALSDSEKRDILAGCKNLTNKIYSGLNLSGEIQVVERLSIGETVLLREGRDVLGFAVCHFGPGSETETDVFYIKFAAVYPDKKQAQHMQGLLSRCSLLSQVRGLNMLFCGVNMARQEAYELLLREGYKIDSLSVAMHNPNRACYNERGVFVLDDWR